MSDNLKLGELIRAPQERDAIHIAVAPVTAAEDLLPGQHVGLLDANHRVGKSDRPIGIIDPFLRHPVEKGDRVWLFLYPNTITALRHDWTHPEFAIASGGPDAASREWIENFAAKIDMTYNRLMRAAENYADYDEWTRDDTEAYKNADAGEWDTFWEHYAVVTGKAAPKDAWAPFTCSC